jgi:hypothetical protein
MDDFRIVTQEIGTLSQHFQYCGSRFDSFFTSFSPFPLSLSETSLLNCNQSQSVIWNLRLQFPWWDKHDWQIDVNCIRRDKQYCWRNQYGLKWRKWRCLRFNSCRVSIMIRISRMKVVYHLKTVLIQEFQHCLELIWIEVTKMKMPPIQFVSNMKLSQMWLIKVIDIMKNSMNKECQYSLESRLIELIIHKMLPIQFVSSVNYDSNRMDESGLQT